MGKRKRVVLFCDDRFMLLGDSELRPHALRTDHVLRAILKPSSDISREDVQIGAMILSLYGVAHKESGVQSVTLVSVIRNKARVWMVAANSAGALDLQIRTDEQKERFWVVGLPAANVLFCFDDRGPVVPAAGVTVPAWASPGGGQMVAELNIRSELRATTRPN